MRTILMTLFCLVSLSPGKSYAQGIEMNEIPFSTAIGIKTNILYDLTTTINVGAEFKVGPRYSLDVSMNYNPWTFSNNKKLKHFLIQPELRYWVCEPFNGHFFGVHAMYSRYNIGGIKLPFVPRQKLESTRYQGNLYGAGVSYGYQWYLSPRWNLEATIGLGYAYLDYTAYECHTCGRELYKKSRHYIGPTKIGISLIYVIK